MTKCSLHGNEGKKTSIVKITNFGGFENLSDALVSDEKLCKTNPELLIRSNAKEFAQTLEKTRPILLEEQYQVFLDGLRKEKSFSKKDNYDKFENIAKQLLENYVDSSDEEVVRKEIVKEFESVAKELLFNHSLSHETYKDEEVIHRQIDKIVVECDLSKCRCGKNVNEDGVRVRVPLNYGHFVLRRNIN